MDKNKCMAELDKIASLEDGWSEMGFGHKFNKSLIELCKTVIERMNVSPEIRPTIEDAIVFDYDGENIGVEVSVSDNGFTGFVSDKTPQDVFSVFEFDTLDDLVSFWNIIVTENR